VLTVRALHHYDRLGLLKPCRTGSGYRVYRERDLEKLEQIVALKFLGLPLKEIAAVLRRLALQWIESLRMQRQALEERQELLGRAIRTIRGAENAIQSGGSADPAILKNIIEAIDMQQDVAVMRKYYSEESWEQHRRYYEDGPSAEWRKLYSDARALLGEYPVGAPAQDLARRWNDLSRRAHSGDPDVQTDSPAAWMDRANWPDVMKQRAAEFRMEEVVAFIQHAELSARKQFFSEEAWARLEELRNQGGESHSAQWRDRANLFRDLEAALGEDPAGKTAQGLVARWKEQLETATGGNAEIKDAMLAGWSHRRRWPESQRWRVERLHMMSWERFEKAADFLDLARAASEERKEKVATAAPKTMLNEILLNEFDEEMSATRRLLERVPEDPAGVETARDGVYAGQARQPRGGDPGRCGCDPHAQWIQTAEAANASELLASFDRNVAACREQLAAMSEDRLAGKMLVNPGVKKPVWEVLRGRGLMNHLIHHRGQLSLYLRMLGVAVPGVYGPFADEK
jgi:DNA-binding transcriptional MerR regulator